MGDEFHVRQSRTACARNALGEETSRVEWCARKRAKSGDEDGEGHLDAEEFRDLFDSQSGGKLAGGHLALHLTKLRAHRRIAAQPRDRKSTRLNSSHLGISYAVFCL